MGLCLWVWWGHYDGVLHWVGSREHDWCFEHKHDWCFKQWHLPASDTSLSKYISSLMVKNDFYYYCHYYYRFTALYPRLPGWAGTRRITHPFTPILIKSNHQSSFICFLHLLGCIASFLFNLRSWQSFCTTSVQVLFGLPVGLTWHLPLYIPYISSPSLANHCILFAAHAHTNAICVAVVR